MKNPKTLTIPKGWKLDVENSTADNAVLIKIDEFYPKDWYKLKTFLSGCYVTNESTIESTINRDNISRHRNILPEKRYAEAVLALSQLIMLRNTYWEIDEFSINWNDKTQVKYCINYDESKLGVHKSMTGFSLFCFGSLDAANHFIENHYGLLETWFTIMS